MYELDIQVKNITISQTFFFLVLLPKLTPQNKDKEKKKKTTNKSIRNLGIAQKGARQDAVLYTWGNKRTLHANCLGRTVCFAL